MTADWKPGDICEVQLGEHVWKLPPIPQKKEILFSDLPIEMQFWHRLDYPEILYDYNPDVTKINAKETEYGLGNRGLIALGRHDTEWILAIREQDLKRREEGVWFMNNGKPMYITGDHYFALQWCRMAAVDNPWALNARDSHYGMFLWFQAKFFYFIKLCEQNKKCLGAYVIKPKKTGISMMYAYALLNYATLNRERNIGTMSKSWEDNKETCRKYFLDGLKSLPKIFKPKEASDNKGMYEFNNPKRKGDFDTDGFDTKIFFVSTKEDGFDGPVYHRIWCDEFPKYEDPYPQIVFDKANKTVKIGLKLNGKYVITSYVNEKDGRAYMEGRKIYYESKLNTLDPVTGTTKSELFCYCITALDSLFTADIEFDKHGYIDERAIDMYLDSRRAALKHDPQALQTEIRQFPKNEEEAWRYGGGGGSTFPYAAARLSKRQTDLMDDRAKGVLPFIQGNLVWRGERLNSEVRFVPLTEEQIMAGVQANYRIYDHEILSKGPMEDRLNVPFREKVKDDYGRYKPKAISPFIAATDPSSYALKSDVKEGSKCAITIMTYPDTPTNTYWNAPVTDKLMLRYLHRPQNPKEFYEEVVKCIWFFGCYIYAEANHSWVITMLKEDNLQNFVLVRNKDRGIVPFMQGARQTLPYSDPQTIATMVREGEQYMEPADRPDVKDKIELMEDEELIKQVIEFKKEDTKKFDLAVCWLLNIMAKNSFMAYRRKLEDMEKMYGHDEMKAAVSGLII